MDMFPSLSRGPGLTPGPPARAAEGASSGREVVVDRQRRVVAETLVLVDRGSAGARGQRRRGDLVVEPPAHVLGPGLAAVAPPGVALVGGLGMQPAIHVDPAALVEHAGEPGTLLGQEARVLLVAAPVLQVRLRVRDVPVAAQDDLAAAR